MHNGALDASFVPLVTNLLLTEIFSNTRGRHIAKRIFMPSKGRCVPGVQNPFQVKASLILKLIWIIVKIRQEVVKI